MPEKENPIPQNPNQGNIPKGNDYFEKGQQGVTPPRPPQNPTPSEDRGASEGVPGWNPPKP
jgi:hypothetical protein